MAKLFNLAGMDSATTGTGTLTLGSALAGLLTFANAGVVDGDVISYSIVDGTSTEVGTGTYTASGTTLTRTTVINSTNSGSKIDCSGSQKVYISVLASDIYNNGWIPATGTWSYSSADDPTYVISVNADMTAIIGVGQKIKLTQTTDKYFIVTAVGAYSGGNTLITVYGGTDYDLANEAVTSPYYSMVKAPFGFPMAIDKWTVTTSDITDIYQSSPTAAQWYNLGSLSISIPIGFWRVVYEAFIYAAKTGANSDQSATLSTGNNNASDPTMTGGVYAYLVASGLIHRERFLTTGAKTTYYLNAKSSTTPTDINFRGDFGTTVIRATCAYL
jgi:hypothetical protein